MRQTTREKIGIFIAITSDGLKTKRESFSIYFARRSFNDGNCTISVL